MLFQMETDRLRYFIATVESGSLSKASRILGVSHSGISKAISALEAEAKLTFFRPQGRGVEITSEGRWFYEKAKKVIGILSELHPTKPLAPEKLRVGLSPVIAVTAAAALAEAIDVPMQICEVEVGELEAKLISGELDFGIAFVPKLRPEIEHLKLGRVRFAAFARKDFIAKHGTVEALRYVVPASNIPTNPLGYLHRDGWPSDLARTSYYSVNSFAIAMNLVKGGKAAAYMPFFVATMENAQIHSSQERWDAVAQKLKQADERDLFLVKLHSSPETAQMKTCSKLIRNLCCRK